MKRLERLAPWIAGALGLVAMFHPTLLSGFHQVQTDPGDSRLVLFIMEHSWNWVRGTAEYWNPPMFYPHPGVTAWCESMLGAAPPYWLFRAVGFLPDTAFQLWMMALAALNFFASYRLFRTWGYGRLPAAAGAYLFSFGAIRVNQFAHQQMLPVFWGAWALQAATRALELRSWGWAVLAGLCLGGQLLAGIYLGWFLLFGLGLYGLFWATSHPLRAPGAALLAGVALAAAVWVFLPVYVHYADAAREFGYWRPDELYLPDWRAWLSLGPGSWLYGWTTRPGGGEIEYRLGLGLVTTLAAVWGLWRARRWQLLAAAGLLVLAASVGWGFIYGHVPGAAGIRTVSRIGEMLLLPAGVGVADLLSRRWSPVRWPYWATAALLVTVGLEQGVTTRSFDKQANREVVEAVVSRIPPGCRAFLFSPVNPGPFWDKYQLDAMMAAMVSGVPTLNGYSGHKPKGWYLDLPITDAELPGVGAYVSEAVRRWEEQEGLEPAAVCVVRADTG